MATQTQRESACELMDWLLAHREQVHYPPVVNGNIERQMSIAWLNDFPLSHRISQLKGVVLSKRGLIVDCSQMATAVILAVGCKNPNGRPIDGYTGTLLATLPHYTDARAAYPLALAVFGPGTGHHVAVVRHRDVVHGNPVLFSQGQESDPRMISLLSEAAGQPHPVTMLSVADL